jgi:outer membrane lipoprotein SlyB
MCDGTGSRLRHYPSASHGRSALKRNTAMKTIATLFAVAALTLAANAADAKGCIKGAVVGGVAGHYAGHHGVLGAIAGCAYGRHHAKEQARQQQEQQPGQAPAGQDNKL